MSENETVSLLRGTGGNPEENCRFVRPRFYILGVVLSLFYLSVGVSGHTESQWIQYYVKLEIFGNLSVSGVESVCKSHNHSSQSYIDYTKVQQKTAIWHTYNILGKTLPVLFVLPFLSSYSDRVGRTFLFTVALSSSFIKYVVECLVIKLGLGLPWVVVANTLDAFTGSYYTIASVSSSYIADVTKRNGGRRIIWMTIFDSVMILNGSVSGLVAGYLIKYIGFFIPILGCAVALLIATIVTVTCLPESLDVRDRVSKTSVCGYVSRTFEFYRSETFRDKKTAYIVLIATYFVEMLTISNRAGLETLYQLGIPFCWTSDKIGIFAAVRHAAQGFVGTSLLRPLKKSMSDLKIGILSAFSNGISFIMTGVATNSVGLYLACIPVTFSRLTISMLKTFISLMTPVDRQGSLFAGITCIECVCMIVTNFTSNMIYAATLPFMHGFVFLVLAGECVVVIVLLIIYGTKFNSQ